MTTLKTIFAYKFIILAAKFTGFLSRLHALSIFLYPQQLQTPFKRYLNFAKTFRSTDFVSDFHQHCQLLHQSNAVSFRGSKFLEIPYKAWTLEDQDF